MSDLRLEPVENRRRAVALRWHERGRRGYFGSRWAAVLPAEWFEADPAPVVESIRKCGRLETIEAVPPSSEDSWEHFVRRHKDTLFGPDGREYTSSGRPRSAAPARAQQAFEAERAARRQADAAASAEQWRREELRRRDLAAAVAIEHRFAAEQERERLDTLARLGLTEQGELTPVYWQTEALYAVEGARRALRASRV